MLAPVATMGGARRCGAQGPAYAGSQGAADTARPRRRRHRITHVRLLHLLRSAIGPLETSTHVCSTTAFGGEPDIGQLRRARSQRGAQQAV
jgi:hypothetical protein